MNLLIKGIYTLIIAFVLCIFVCPVLIPFLHRLKFGQTVRDDGPQTHLQKTGTPTMGGLAFLAAFVLAAIFMTPTHETIAVILVTIGFGLIGFIDDYIKVVKKRSLGLKPMQKIVGQLIICVLFMVYLNKSGVGTEIYIPFTGGKTWDLGILFIPFCIIAVLATVNGVNLTDGLDGLADGVTLIVCVFFTMCAYAAGNGIVTAGGAMIGGLLAFLIFNAYPAKVFMGDTGSLALGGFIVACAFILKMPLFILIAGIIYVVETLSVAIQVTVYKKTKKRVFKMAPLHHHFELSGWSETKVVTLFYVITAIACLVAFLGAQNIF
ncbi:MAG: phospho-N-acetylmuramoyl-pentapeptide-transferase [Clostridiales bacterium]|nr:phospho-N-acetylmuramoyl-pentapeptide-transferase [Clostridiales bacterium]